LGEHFLIKTMEHNVKRARDNKAMNKSVAIGKSIKDFNAKNHEGKEFNLLKVLQKNKYVLVEFWASWCGPCIGEIPNMKKAYTRFHKKGFEIISFSLDKNKLKWDNAFNQKQIPWIDTSDLLAHKSPIVKMYGVSGIPANFLINNQGEIIFKNLRGGELEEKLEELLGVN